MAYLDKYQFWGRNYQIGGEIVPATPLLALQVNKN
jgi:hypothetical protein